MPTWKKGSSIDPFFEVKCLVTEGDVWKKLADFIQTKMVAWTNLQLMVDNLPTRRFESRGSWVVSGRVNLNLAEPWCRLAWRSDQVNMCGRVSSTSTWLNLDVGLDSGRIRSTCGDGLAQLEGWELVVGLHGSWIRSAWRVGLAQLEAGWDLDICLHGGRIRSTCRVGSRRHEAGLDQVGSNGLEARFRQG